MRSAARVLAFSKLNADYIISCITNVIADAERRILSFFRQFNAWLLFTLRLGSFERRDILHDQIARFPIEFIETRVAFNLGVFSIYRVMLLFVRFPYRFRQHSHSCAELNRSLGDLE